MEIVESDPQGADALALLRAAAIEARALYPELQGPDEPWPTNGPTPPRGAYFVAYVAGRPLAMGAHRPLDELTSEVRRMYTLASARRTGAARAILTAVERHARAQGFRVLKLETGYRQLPAMRLYETMGYRAIEPFGAYVGDPTSRCFEKTL